MNSPEVVYGEEDEDQPTRIHLVEGPANENSPEIVDGKDDKDQPVRIHHAEGRPMRIYHGVV